MLEIVFDENLDREFLGQKYPYIPMQVSLNADFAVYRQMARELIENNSLQRTVIVNFLGENEALNNFALALDVEAYYEKTLLESVVFKIKNSTQMMNNYKPYMALANSIRYARDLFCLNEEEMKADIKRLGYLGLRVEEDYIKHQITLEWPGKEPARRLIAQGKNAAIILVGILKTWAICKESFAAEGVIFEDEKSQPGMINNVSNEEEIIKKIIEYVREYKNGN